MISNIYIKNFRSIKELDFEVSNLATLIGPNSSGKTNILKAIDLVLGEGWTTKAKVARELFNDPNKEIYIALDFSLPISMDGKYGPYEIVSIELEMSLYPELKVVTTINNKNKFYDQDQFKKKCHFIYIPAERDLTSELRVSQWTMLGKMMKLIYENYISHYSGNEDKLKSDFEREMQPAKTFLEDDFSADEVTYKKFVDSFKGVCSSNSIGLANDFSPILDIYNLNWFYKTLQIHIDEGYPNKQFNSEEVGAGMKNLLMISIFQTYAHLMGKRVIFGIEEPEIYLYPNAQRALYKNFIDLSSETQIFYTTHNPNFVDAERADDINIVRKTHDKGTVILEKNPAFTTPNAERFKYKIYTQFSPERNEIFFGNKILLIEGDSDKILFTTLAENRWGLDLNKDGITLISCGGKPGVNYFAGVCNLVGIDDFFVIYDKDDELDDPSILEDCVRRSKGLCIDPNLENLLGLPEGDSGNKVKNAHEWALYEANDIPKEFDIVKDFLSGNIPVYGHNDTISVEDLPF